MAHNHYLKVESAAFYAALREPVAGLALMMTG